MAERRTRGGKVAGSCPGRSGGRNVFSRIKFLAHSFRCPFHFVLPQQHVKVPVILFCQKCRWEVAAKYTHVDTVNWHMADLCPQNVRRAAVLRGTSHVTTNQCCKHFGGYSETRCATLDTHTTNPQWVCPEAQQCYDRRVVL